MVQPGPGKGPTLRSSSESEQLRVRELRHKLQKAFLGKEIKEEVSCISFLDTVFPLFSSSRTLAGYGSVQ